MRNRLLFFILVLPTVPSRSLRSSPQVVHHFGAKHAHIVWPQDRRLNDQSLSPALSNELEDQEFKVMHITDAHVSLTDEDPPHTQRMYSAMLQVCDRTTGQPMHPKDQLIDLFKKAKAENVDLIALGGDIINFPSKSLVDWLLTQLEEHAPGVPFVYTAGNHDWHLENVDETTYDASRKRELNSTLRPLFAESVAVAERDDGPFAGLTYGFLRQKGVDVIFLDNSNYQIDAEQLAFAKKHFSRDAMEHGPLLLLLHMPLALAGVTLEPKEVCGHQDWGAYADTLSETEGRPRWPESGNSPSTMAFIELVKTHTAPAGRVVAIMSGHVHKDFTNTVPTGTPQTSLACVAGTNGCSLDHSWDAKAVDIVSRGVLPDLHPSRATGALQYSTLDAAEGGYRMLTVRVGKPDTPVMNEIF